MTAIAVLAVGTDIGKTHVSAQLLGHLRSRGWTVGACKPLMSGFGEDDLPDSDAGRLLIACGETPTTDSIDCICLHRFSEALAPNVAARRAGVTLAASEIVDFARKRLERELDCCLLEGAGGVLSPLTDTLLNVDLVHQLGLPVVLVSSNYLGAISHTLTALEALAARDIPVLAIAVSQPTPDFGDPGETGDELSRWTKVPCVSVPFSPIDRPGDGIEKLWDLISQHGRAAASPG